MARRDQYSWGYLDNAALALLHPGGHVGLAIATGKHGDGLQLSGSNPKAVITLDSQQYWRMHGWWKTTDASAYRTVFQWWDGGSAQVALAINGGKFQFYTNTNIGAATTTTIATGTWYHIQMAVKIAASTGTAKLILNDIGRLSGTPEINLTNVTTKLTANSTSDSQGPYINGSGVTDTWDDLVINDGTGSDEFNDLQGVLTVFPRLAIVDGHYLAFTPSTGTDHYACINKSVPADTPNLSDSVAGDRDGYLFENLPSNANTIKGRKIRYYGLKDSAGARTVQLFTRQGSTDYDNAAQALSVSNAFYGQVIGFNPGNPGNNYTRTQINDEEIGQQAG